MSFEFLISSFGFLVSGFVFWVEKTFLLDPIEIKGHGHHGEGQRHDNGKPDAE
jgi:hypothetical protein